MTVTTTGGVDVAGPARSEGLACLREALDNVAEHAAASEVKVTMDGGASEVVMVVSDDGLGFEKGRLRAALGGSHSAGCLRECNA